MCGGDKTAAHHAARNLVCRFSAAAGLGPELERSNLLPPRPGEPADTGLRRPADVYLPAWDSGTPAALDLAITPPQRQGSLLEASHRAGATAKWYEDHKCVYLDTQRQCEAQGIKFVPVVAERSSGWGPSALAVFRKIAKIAAARDGTPTGKFMSEYLEGLSVAIRRAAARAVLKRADARSDFPRRAQAVAMAEVIATEGAA